MPFNGSGTYTLPAGNPVVTGTTISSTVQNNTMSDVATALSTCITSNGQSTPTANIPFGNNKITGLAAGTALTDAVNLGQIQGNGSQFGTVTGTDTIVLAISPAPSAYAAGQVFRFVTAGANTTGAVTLNVSSLGAKNVTKRMAGGVVALAIGDLVSGVEYSFTYDGTEFVLNEQRPYSQGVAIASATTVALNGSTGDYVQITGTTAITAITLAQGEERTLEFAGILTFTNGASLILPGGANITTAAGDVAIVRGEASGVVRCVNYMRANGQSVAVQVTSVNGATGAVQVNLSGITASLSGNVTINSASYFDGPSIAQGTSGTWFVSGTVTVTCGPGSTDASAKLWDGTTVIASTQVFVTTTNPVTISLSGMLASPAGNLRISVASSSGAGTIYASLTGLGKDSTITAIRIA